MVALYYVLIFFQCVELISSFRIATSSIKSRNSFTLSSANKAVSSTVPTLTERSLWRIIIKFQKEGFQDVEATARIRFIQERNYEPPQGRIFVEDDYNGLIKVDEKGYAGTWTLSEDKNDRKDGLWVWGLFEEPKYPYLYFSFGIFSTIILPSNEEIPIFDGKSIPKNRIDIRFNHMIPSKVEGVKLSDGLITYQLTEMMRADPLGIGGQVDVGDILNAGTIDIQYVPE